ncbi:DUF2278 family protein [Paraburkholderia sp. RCC_158]|uniref:DUF2278 family protein n=1 Tax=Paraburkholderia sp. RCC_158 TaxID=3239220 RepID=UPI003524802B
MPLQTPYGVNVGPLHDADLVNPDTGQWPHYHVRISGLSGQIMDSAINLKSLTDIQIEYRSRQFGIQEPLFASVVELPDGQHLLAQTSWSGALDYVRHGGITGTADWILQTGDNLIDKLNALLSGVERLYIFGATYSSGIGVHDVHMNQGDPDGSSFQHLDEIWQDGGVLFQYGGSQPRLEVLQIKFETQSLFTDDHGLPIDFRIPPRLYYYIPRWRWPPGDPMTNDERRVLLESGLIKIASWAAVIDDVPCEARAAMTRELHTQLGSHLPEASEEHLGRIASYVVKMGQRLRQLRL